MKKILLISLSILALSVQAQEVSTLYFLDNAPMRHLMNPSFQPVSKGYVSLFPIGYMSSWEGNNSLTLSDVLYVAPNGATVTPLHPEYGDRDKFYKTFPNPTAVYMSNNMNLIAIGSRVKEAGYFTFGASLKFDGVTRLPNALDNLSSLGSNTQVYTEVAFGYSHKINEFWTVGGKLKFLMGTAYVGLQHSDLTLTSSIDQIHLTGQGNVQVAGPLYFDALPNNLNYQSLEGFNASQLLYSDSESITKMILNYIKPSGYGGAIDFGVTVHPVKQLQISAAFTDLGLIYWNRGVQYKAVADTTFMGAGPFEYHDYVYNETFNTDSLWNDVQRRLLRLGTAYNLRDRQDHFLRMITSKVNVGIDGQFFNNRLDIGVLSKTMFYNGYISEEVTFGLAGKPFHWLNMAVSYSLMENGKYSNIGAGLGFMPYDGINLTLAMDYIPIYYAQKDGNAYYPSRTKGVNFAFGLSIVWGSNPKKEPKMKVAKGVKVEYKASTTKIKVAAPTAGSETESVPTK